MRSLILYDEVITEYLDNKSTEKYSNHWVFNNIEPNEYLFKQPSYADNEIVKNIYNEIKVILEDFNPLNEEIFNNLFPDYNKIVKESKVLLVVGCPEMYDAMFMEYDNDDYIVFDLINLSKYLKYGYSINKIVTDLLTHEFVHRCIKEKFPNYNERAFTEKLNYITFDEGFAHLLAYKENIKDHDFSNNFYKEKYEKSKLKLKEAISEQDKEKQKSLLQDADVGSYWDKYAAIAGKLYLAQHINELDDIYNKGWKNIINDILNEKEYKL